jgi:hypothetical protein
MVKLYNNLSPATKLLLQSFLAVLSSVLSTVLFAVYQSYNAAGTFNPQALIIVALVTFIPLFGKAMHDWVPPHAQQIIQAGKDNEAALQDALTRQQMLTSNALNRPVQQAMSAQQPHVVVQASPSLKFQDIQAIATQLALNLLNMAGVKSAVLADTPSVPTITPAPATPAPDPYIDPLSISAKLPAYVPPVAIPDMATQSVPQMPFPAQVAISPAMP